MADIAMCQNKTCPSRSHCYRHTEPTSKPYQWYAAFEPKDGDDRCDEYIADAKGTGK